MSKQLELPIPRVAEPDRNFKDGGRSFYFFDFDDNVAFLTTPLFLFEKSTGRELFNGAYIDAFIDRCRAARAGATAQDVVATAVAFSSASVADALRRFVAVPLAELIVSGGGAKNPALVSALSAAVRPLAVRRFDDVFYDGEAKEAVAFALMGYLHLGGHAGNVPSATGARGPRVLGKLTPAPLAR